MWTPSNSRWKLGFPFAGFGVALAGVGAVFAGLDAIALAWVTCLVGLGIAVAGLIYSALPPTKQESREKRLVQLQASNRLLNEKRELLARKADADRLIAEREVQLGVAGNYSDTLRAQSLRATIQALDVARDQISTRLDEIELELESL